MQAMDERWKKVVLLLGCVFYFLLSGCVASQNGAGGAGKIEGNTLSVKGKVQQVSLEEGMMVVAPPKGERITVKFTAETPVKGGSTKGITKFQPVMVMYVAKGGENRAVSIELLPQGSCGGS